MESRNESLDQNLLKFVGYGQADAAKDEKAEESTEPKKKKKKKAKSYLDDL